MKTIIKGALLLGAASLFATGCIIVGDGDDNDPLGDINVSWDVQPACPAGATTAQLVAAPVNGGADIDALFDCEDGSGFIGSIPAGTYDVFVNITDSSTNGLFAQSFAEANVEVVAGRSTTVDPFVILADDAFFGFAWQINEGGAASPDCAVPEPNYLEADCNAGGALPCPPNSTCASDGVCRIDTANVGFLATFVDDVTVQADDLFECVPAGSATTKALPLGAYSDVIISITNDAGAEYYAADRVAAGSLEVGNEIADLGTFVFDL